MSPSSHTGFNCPRPLPPVSVGVSMSPAVTLTTTTTGTATGLITAVDTLIDTITGTQTQLQLQLQPSTFVAAPVPLSSSLSVLVSDEKHENFQIVNTTNENPDIGEKSENLKINSEDYDGKKNEKTVWVEILDSKRKRIIPLKCCKQLQITEERALSILHNNDYNYDNAIISLQAELELEKLEKINLNNEEISPKISPKNTVPISTEIQAESVKLKDYGISLGVLGLWSKRDVELLFKGKKRYKNCDYFVILTVQMLGTEAVNM